MNEPQEKEAWGKVCRWYIFIKRKELDISIGDILSIMQKNTEPIGLKLEIIAPGYT